MKSIKWKIIGTVLTVIVVLLAVVLNINYLNTKKILLEQFYQKQENLVDAKKEKMTGWLEDKMRIVDITSYSDLISHPQPVKTENYLAAIMKDNPDFLAIYMATSDGFYADGSRWVPDKDYIPQERPWYKEAKAAGKIIFTQPYVDSMTKKLVVSIAKPIYSPDGSLRAVVVGDVTLDVLVKYTSQIKTEKTGFAFLVDKAGLVLVHPDKKLMMQKNLLEDSNEGLKKIAQLMISGQQGAKTYSPGGKETLLAYAPLPHTGWSLAISVPVAEGMEKLESSLWWSIILGLILLLIAVGVIYYLGSFLAKPIQDLTVVTQALAQGDLNQKVKVTSKDEVGVWGENFNNMAENLRQLIKKMLDSSFKLTGSSKDIAAASEDNARASEEVAKTITEIAQGTNNQAMKAQNGARGLDGLAANMEIAYESCGKVGKAVENFSSLIEKGLSNIEQENMAVEKSKTSTQNVSLAINLLADHSQKIDSIVETITAIAEQTNLLALNAAIEAARAGEQGKGFAVVAEEVKKLAEESGLAAGQISQLIKEIQSGTFKAVEEMDKAIEIISEQYGVVEETGKIFRDISQAAIATRKETEKITQGVRLVQEEVDKTIEFIQDIVVVSDQNAAGAEEISAAAQEQTATSEQISINARALAGLAEELEKEIRQFKI